MSDKNEELKIYIRISGQGISRFITIKEFMGLKNDTEVIRSLIAWYWKTHQDELTPQLHYVNADEKGAKVFDRTILALVQINFSRDGINCTHCRTGDCKHTRFALEQPNIQSIVENKRKEGWNLPEV